MIIARAFRAEQLPQQQSHTFRVKPSCAYKRCLSSHRRQRRLLSPLKSSSPARRLRQLRQAFSPSPAELQSFLARSSQQIRSVRVGTQRKASQPKAEDASVSMAPRVIDVLNVAKAITAALIFACAYTYGLSDLRQVVYTGLHLSYLTYWYVHQWAMPGWANTVFGVPAKGIPYQAFIIVAFGIFYALPAWLAFSNPQPISPITAIAATILGSIGGCLNAGSDFYKTGQKTAGVKLVKTHIYDGRLGPHPNHVGDWMRYSSFALASGTLLAWTVPAFVVAFNFSSYSDPKRTKRDA